MIDYLSKEIIVTLLELVQEKIFLRGVYMQTRFDQPSCDGGAIDRTMGPCLAQTTIMIIMKMSKEIGRAIFNLTIAECINSKGRS